MILVIKIIIISITSYFAGIINGIEKKYSLLVACIIMFIVGLYSFIVSNQYVKKNKE